MNEQKIHISIFREVTGDTIESDWCKKYVNSLIQSLAKIIKNQQVNVAQLALNMEPKPAQNEPEYWLWDKMLYLMPENILEVTRTYESVEIISTAENVTGKFFGYETGKDTYELGVKEQ